MLFASRRYSVRSFILSSSCRTRTICSRHGSNSQRFASHTEAHLSPYKHVYSYVSQHHVELLDGNKNWMKRDTVYPAGVSPTPPAASSGVDFMRFFSGLVGFRYNIGKKGKGALVSDEWIKQTRQWSVEMTYKCDSGEAAFSRRERWHDSTAGRRGRTWMTAARRWRADWGLQKLFNNVELAFPNKVSSSDNYSLNMVSHLSGSCT